MELTIPRKAGPLPAFTKPKKMLMMRMIIVMLSVCLQVSAGSFSQSVTLSVKNASLESVLRKVKKQTGYDFFFETRLIRQAGNVSLAVKNQPLTNVLDACFSGQPVAYKIADKTIIVTERESSPAPSAPIPPPLPPLTVKGKVTDEKGNPVEGAGVLVKGSNNGTTTNASGEWELRNVPDNATLIFSYVGYNTLELPVNGKTSINASLTAVNAPLEQIVVIGYGAQRKRDLTGSITTVKGDDLARMPATNPVASLQGKVAGLTVINSGRAGSSPTVRIRGVNSTNNSDPLFVVDGIFQTNIDYLNPADIESMEVLRDPSSIAIFGLLGGNGVIIVTTKRAAKGKTRVSLQSSVGIQHVTNKIDVTDAAGFKKLYNAQLANLNAQPFDYTNYTANTDWQSLILRDAVLTSHSLNISNSSDKSTTLLNIGYNNQDGVLKYDNYQKYIVRLNEEIRLNKNIRVGGDLTGFHWIQQAPGADLNNALWAAPIVPIQIDAKTYYSMPSFQRAQVGNPVAALNRNNKTSINKGYRIVGSLFAEVKFLSNFTFKSSVYTDLGFNNSRSYTPLPFSFVNLGEGTIPTNTTYDQAARTSVTQTQAEFRKYQQDHTLTFDKTISNDHRLTLLAGFTTLYSASTNITGNRRDTLLNIPNDPAFWYLGIANASNPGTFGGGGGEDSYMSFLGRASYAFKNKYLLNLTFRRDGTSKFAPDKRWGNFSSVGAGWVVTEETFAKNIKLFDFFKIRAAWGQVGNAMGTGSSLYLPVLNTSSIGVFGNNVYSSVTPAYVPDPNLHWEVVNGTDIGLEFRMLNNRLNADINYYNRTTKDILTFITLPGSAGSYSYYTNLGNISNKGLEVSLGWRDKIGKDLNYNITANFSYNKNNVESIGNNITFQLIGNNGANKTETGQSIGYFYGYRQVGVYQSTADLDKVPHMANSLPGDIAYADVDGDGAITPADRTYLGTPFPKFNFGVNIGLSYKQFDASLEGQGVAGNKVYTQRRTATFATLNYETNRLNAWTGPGTSNVEPILDNTRANNFLFSNYYLEPGDYFRIRTVQLGYTFGAKALSNIGVQQLRLYLSAQNLHTFSRTTGYTPEAGLGSPIASGADNGTYPIPAIYSFGLNLTF
ncbi:TonB-dependent receptor [Sediminibacterium ginsengisoli]|uniref:TonB-linked outer membrane protein, SusC/RagA family n=1 Tax=Sediminibacterium ginsengisoli TaxID=413434 RepID=A0A1T4LJI5_9BACT|nr:TonB-dependent receptor [Sediminibacterium ginsengisoli]SJZ54903.1 TonB-linked outer membrane protein, SusC/RagA family [Sediminibacterium ginsengisoli]